MLPDLPNLKNDIERALLKYFQNQVDARLGVFNEAPKHTAREGNRMRTIRADGSVEDREFKEASAELTWNVEEVPQLTIKERKEKLDNMADEMARQISQNLFGTLNEVLGKAGQVVDRKGKPFDAEGIFEALEKMQLGFDESGKMQKLSIVTSPELEIRAKRVLEQLESDPTLRRRYEEIIERKRIEWLDREASRKLAG